MAWPNAPVSIGTGNSKTSGTTFTIVTTAAVAAGDLIIVGAGGVTTTPAFSEMAGTGGVSGGGVTWKGGWINGASHSIAGGQHYWGVPSSTVASGTTLTITLANTCKAMAGVAMVMTGSPAGITNANVQDVGETGTAGTSTSHSSFACTLVSDHCVVVGVLMYNSASQVITESATDSIPKTALANTGTSGGAAASNFQIHVGYSTSLDVAAGSAGNYSASIATSTFGLAGVQSFVAAVVQEPAPPVLVAMQAVARASNW